MDALEFIFTSNDSLVENVDGTCSSSSSDLTSDTTLEDSLFGFDFNDLFNVSSATQSSSNNNNIPDHAYCLQENNNPGFELNFDFSLLDSNIFDTIAAENMSNVQTEQKDLNLFDTMSHELMSSDGSPTSSEEYLQFSEPFNSQQHIDCHPSSVLPLVVQESAHKLQSTILSEDEQVLLAKEGINLPVNVPLTREEERILKIVRRKIRNKISAKVSRMKKQNYVEGLEQRIKICTQQNRDLQTKVERLQKQNLSLALQLKKFQDVLFKPRVTVIARKKQMQASSCLMVFLVSFALFILPSMVPWLEDNSVRNILDNPSSLATGRKILQDMNLLKLDYVEEHGALPQVLSAGSKSLSDYDDVSLFGDQALGNANWKPSDHYVVVLDNNSTIRTFNKNDL